MTITSHLAITTLSSHWSTLHAGMCFTLVQQGCELISDMLRAYRIKKMQNLALENQHLPQISLICLPKNLKKCFKGKEATVTEST